MLSMVGPRAFAVGRMLKKQAMQSVLEIFGLRSCSLGRLFEEAEPIRPYACCAFCHFTHHELIRSHSRQPRRLVIVSVNPSSMLFMIRARRYIVDRAWRAK